MFYVAVQTPSQVPGKSKTLVCRGWSYGLLSAGNRNVRPQEKKKKYVKGVPQTFFFFFFFLVSWFLNVTENTWESRGTTLPLRHVIATWS